MLTCDPGKGYSGDPYKQFDTRRASRRRSRAATAPSRRGSSCDSPPINNLDLSISKRFSIFKSTKFEIRLDVFNALNHTQFTGVNATANFSEPDRLDDHQPAVRRAGT